MIFDTTRISVKDKEPEERFDNTESYESGS